MQWVCDICGFVHDGEEPPDICPVCGAPRSKFSELEREWDDEEEPEEKDVPGDRDDDEEEDEDEGNDYYDEDDFEDYLNDEDEDR